MKLREAEDRTAIYRPMILAATNWALDHPAWSMAVWVREAGAEPEAEPECLCVEIHRAPRRAVMTATRPGSPAEARRAAGKVARELDALLAVILGV